MACYGLPVLYALFLWWFSTGLILYLDGLPRRTYRWSLAAATLVLGLAMYGVGASAADATPAGAYLAFTCGVLVWGWQEMAFLMGGLTGPRRHACPEGCVGWRHAVHAVQAILYHELALAAGALVVVLLSWGGTNRVAAWTYLILWVMRTSAKLNLFLGVPNLQREFLPAHLQFLGSFLRRAPMNLLFPVSITGATVVAAILVQRAAAADGASFDAAGFTFLATMLGLAVIEHWILVLPLPAASLWRWSLRSRSRPPLHAERECGILPRDPALPPAMP